MTTPDQRIAEIAAGLSKAQRQTIVAAKPLIDARILVPASIERKRWPIGIVDTYSVAFRRLTPLGTAVRAYLLSEREPHAE